MLFPLFITIFSIATLYNFRAGIYFVIFSMPLYLWRFSFLTVPSTALEAMIYILFLLWLRNNIKTIASFKLEKKRPLLLLGVALLFAGVVVSTANSEDIRTSLGILKGWFFDPLLFFIVFISSIEKREHIASSLTSWLLSGAFVSLVGIFYLLSGKLTYDGRLRAFFLSPNYLAMYVAPAFLIAFWFLLEGKNWKLLQKSKIENWKSVQFLSRIAILIIIFICLYFTHSYGAFLGITAGVLYIFASSYWSDKTFQRRHLKLAEKFHLTRKNCLLAAIVLIVFVSFIFTTAAKFNQIIDSTGRSSFHSRLMIWRASVEILKDHPFFGIGPGTFQDVYLSYADRFDEPYLEWAVPQPHNTFLAFYLQTGLIGFIGFVLILIWFFTGRNRTSYPHLYKLACALMVYTLVHGLIDTTYWKNDLSLMFWLTVGLAAVVKDSG